MAKSQYDCVTRPAGRQARLAGLAMLSLVAGLGSAPAHASSASAAASIAAAERYDGAGISDFYAARGGRPLWLVPGQGIAVQGLMALLDSAELDGVEFDRSRMKQLSRALRAARGNRDAAARAEMLLSDSFVRYVRALRTIDPAAAGWEINDAELSPRAPSAMAALQAAAASGDLSSYVDRMGWMHSSYADLRRALARAEMRGDAGHAQMLRANLLRTRLLPGEGSGRYVLVNTAAQRLYMVDNGQVVDWMKVVVGKPEQPTPMMAAMIRYTAVNPYWNLPPDLVAERVAPNVLKQGNSYLVAKGYKVLESWDDNAKVISTAGIDWNEVAAGKVELRMRQNPGPANAMGRMKFMFPNPRGVYLHDTPNKELLANEARLFSAGCVRLEAAPRLAKWLYGKPLATKGAKPEQKVPLPAPVPVYLAYLTAVPQGSTVVYFDDVYHRDRTALATIASR